MHRKPPEPWSSRRQQLKSRWTIPLWAFEWFWEWVAYVLSNWSFLEALEYLSSFGGLIAVIFYFTESGNRIKQKHYQAWQVINTAQGKGGNGGRIDALQELNADRIPLVGVDVSGSFLQGIHLPSAHLSRSTFSRRRPARQQPEFRRHVGCLFPFRELPRVHPAQCRFGAGRLTDSDFVSADFTGTDLSGATLENADLRNANLSNLRWRDNPNLKNANIFGVKNAPEGFIAYALTHGAVQKDADFP
jgi:hypothetical protein